ncbi:MAG: manganese transporter [Gemmatimonadales bacterium]|nr:MAG: manganese transporter [Gemmatimonadales bacterium]
MRLGLFVLCLASIAGCVQGADKSDDGRLHVVATIGMISDIVGDVGGSRLEVEGLMGPGVDPHLFKASAGDVRALARADAVFYNGLHLEAAMAEVLEEMNERKPTFAVTDGIDRELLHRSAAFQNNYDPHVWFDVTMWSSAVEQVEAALIQLDPAGETEFRANAAALRDTLQELDAWVRVQVAQVPPELRVLITAHDAFEYFGKQYGFQVIGLQGISTASEAGTGDVQRMVDAIIDKRIPAIFIETSIPRRTIEAVQAAVRSRGFEVVIGGSLFSDAMGNPGTPEGKYPGMIRHNVNTIVDALTAEQSQTAE